MRRVKKEGEGKMQFNLTLTLKGDRSFGIRSTEKKKHELRSLKRTTSKKLTSKNQFTSQYAKYSSSNIQRPQPWELELNEFDNWPKVLNSRKILLVIYKIRF